MPWIPVGTTTQSRVMEWEEPGAGAKGGRLSDVAPVEDLDVAGLEDWPLLERDDLDDDDLGGQRGRMPTRVSRVQPVVSKPCSCSHPKGGPR